MEKRKKTGREKKDMKKPNGTFRKQEVRSYMVGQ